MFPEFYRWRRANCLTTNLGGKINHPEIRLDTSSLIVPSYKSEEEGDQDY